MTEDADAPTPADGKDLAGQNGSLVVLEGPDGSGRSTQIALLSEWLESNGFAVGVVGLRRSELLAKNIDEAMSRNVVTPTTLALMYATDFFDQLENRIVPAMRAGFVVLADRYIYTLIARSAVRGIDRAYLEGVYAPALRPDIVYWLNVSPEVSFEREFNKAEAISYWEAGRDLNLSSDLFDSFVRYQTLVRREFEGMVRRHGFLKVNGEQSVRAVNWALRKGIASRLGVASTSYRPSANLAHLWR